MKKKIVRKIEYLVSIFYYFFLKLIFCKRPQVILYYHGVTKEQRPQFIKQMEYLSSYYKVVPLSKFVDGIGNFTEGEVAITFDDAFVNLIDNVLPVLKNNSLSASIFVPVSYLASLPGWKISDGNQDKKEMVMTAEELLECERAGMEIYSHTLNHPYLTELDDSKLKDEIFRSKELLEGILQHEVTMISYPHGDYNEQVIKIVCEAGYKAGFTIEPKTVKSGVNRFAIPRFMIGPDDSIFKLKMILSGAYEAVYLLRRIKGVLSTARK